jgi:hypothetical protein
MATAVTLTPSIIDFIGAQPLFFVATAGAEGRVNVSPKALDSLRVLSETRIIWLSLTGSGNETAAHVLENGLEAYWARKSSRSIDGKETGIAAGKS